MQRVLALFRFGAVLTLAACASSGATSGARQQPDLITAAEISGSSASNAWDLINQLRPIWLKPQPVRSIGSMARSEVLVYVDGQRFGEISSLSTVSTSGIKSIQWYDATKAQAVLSNIGQDPIAGAIVIKTQ